MYAEVRSIDDTNEITFFNKQNNNLALSIRLDSSRIYPVSCVFGAGILLNLLREDMVEPDWMSSIRSSRKT